MSTNSSKGCWQTKVPRRCGGSGPRMEVEGEDARSSGEILAEVGREPDVGRVEEASLAFHRQPGRFEDPGAPSARTDDEP